MLKAYPWAAVGFFFGAIIGFAWAQSTKKQIPTRVKTTVSGGIVTVQFDAKGAATDGLLNLFG